MLLRNGPFARNLTGGCRMPLELGHLDWRIVNDGVMGGCSHSQLEIQEDSLLFHGQLSIENRGGFVSVLGRLEHPLHNLAGFRLDVTGDGRRYQLRLRETDSARHAAWRAFFNTRQTRAGISVGMDEFNAVMRGQPAIGARPLELTPVRYIGFMLTSRRPGPFELRVHGIEIIQSGDETPRSG